MLTHYTRIFLLHAFLEWTVVQIYTFAHICMNYLNLLTISVISSHSTSVASEGETINSLGIHPWSQTPEHWNVHPGHPLS